MPIIELACRVAAPIDRCFDLSRSLDLHAEGFAASNERAVAGRTSGLIALAEQVTWEATHFGVRQRLTSRITQFDRPTHFRDSMVSGAFARFDHDHMFEALADGGTLMRDRFDFDAPLGPLGWIAERLFLTRYMTDLLRGRNEAIRRAAEGGDWRRFLESVPSV